MLKVMLSNEDVMMVRKNHTIKELAWEPRYVKHRRRNENKQTQHINKTL